MGVVVLEVFLPLLMAARVLKKERKKVAFLPYSIVNQLYSVYSRSLVVVNSIGTFRF